MPQESSLFLQWTKKLLLLSILWVGLVTSLHAQSWQWAKQAYSISEDELQSICIDKDGNTYICGQFGLPVLEQAQYMIFDNDTVFNDGVNQAYLAKYSPTGNVLWAKGIGGNNFNSHHLPCDNCERTFHLHFDSITNSILLTGNIYSEVEFGDTVLSGYGAMYISKLDLNGSFIWTRIIFCNQDLFNYDIATDHSGNIFIYGYGGDSINFGSSKIPSGGFLASYSVTGQFLWAKKEFAQGYLNQLVCSGDFLYVVGSTNNNRFTIDTASFNLTSYPNAFIAQFTTSGSLVTAKFVESHGTSEAGGFGVDQFGNVFITGGFHLDANFEGDTLFCENIMDLFYAKYDASLNLQWVRQASSTISVGGGKLVILSDGSSYIGGGINGLSSFGNIEASSVGLEMFVARYDHFGECLGVDVCLGYAGQLCADKFGNYYIAGRLERSVNFGSISLSPYSHMDIFIAKHDVITGIQHETRPGNQQLLIYANPTAGQCHVTIPDDFLNEKSLTLNIFDNTGRLIQSKTLELNDGKISLNLEQEAKGIYHISLTNGKKSYQGNVIFN